MRSNRFKDAFHRTLISCRIPSCLIRPSSMPEMNLSYFASSSSDTSPNIAGFISTHCSNVAATFRIRGPMSSASARRCALWTSCARTRRRSSRDSRSTRSVRACICVALDVEWPGVETVDDGTNISRSAYCEYEHKTINR